MDDPQRADEATVVAFMAAVRGPELGPGMAAVAEVNRLCELEDYEEITVPSFDVDGELVAYASPEATYALTKSFLQAATASIVIGIYDFTSGPLKDFLLQAMQRGVKVTLMLDLDGRDGETPLFEELKTFGCKARARAVLRERTCTLLLLVPRESHRHRRHLDVGPERQLLGQQHPGQ